MTNFLKYSNDLSSINNPTSFSQIVNFINLAKSQGISDIDVILLLAEQLDPQDLDKLLAYLRQIGKI
jgi:molybdenum cofactor biosynthesis enzyme MoaA